VEGVIVFIVVAAAVAIFLTTRRGQATAARFGFSGLGKGAASQEDREFFLRECGGDATLVRERLAEARQRNPDMTEAEAYRQAIRVAMQGRRDQIFEGVELPDPPTEDAAAEPGSKAARGPRDDSSA
jgi:hypothetical protein